MNDLFAREDSIPQLGTCTTLWNCIDLDFNMLVAMCGEKSWNVFLKKNLITFPLKKERHEHLGWQLGE